MVLCFYKFRITPKPHLKPLTPPLSSLSPSPSHPRIESFGGQVCVECEG